jgi:hypothetical protein
VVDDEMAALDLDPDEAEVWCSRVEDDGAAVVGAGAVFERAPTDLGALPLRHGAAVVLAGRAAEETLSAAATNPGGIRVLAAHDAVVFPQRRLDAPDVQLVDGLLLLDGDVRDVDLKWHGGQWWMGADDQDGGCRVRLARGRGVEDWIMRTEASTVPVARTSGVQFSPGKSSRRSPL